DIGERREDGLEPAGLRRGAAARRFIAAPEDSDAAEASCGPRYGKRLRIHNRAPARVSARTASRTWTGNRLCDAGSLRCPDARYINSTCGAIKLQRRLRLALKPYGVGAMFAGVGVLQAPGIPKTARRPSPVHRSHREGSGLVAQPFFVSA